MPQYNLAGYSGIFRFTTNAQRISEIEKVCKSMDNKDHHRSSIQAHNLLSSDHLKVIFCPVPKAASTSWKHLLIELSQNEEKANTSKVHDYEYLRHLGIHRFSDFTLDDIKEKLTAYFKLLSVRHPLHRLVSAYMDKMLTDTWYKPHLRPYIIERYRYGIENRSMDHYINMFRGSMTGDIYLPPFNKGSPHRVTFPEYVKFVADTFNTMEILPDIHVLPIIQLCQPCTLQYDYIATLESIEEDARYVIDKLNSETKSVQFGKYNNHRISRLKQKQWKDENKLTTSTIKEYYSEISDDLMTGILEIYKLDMELFGYTWMGQKRS